MTKKKKAFKLSSSLSEISENLLLMILQHKTPKVSLLCCSIVQKYGKESCWELTICVLQQTSINNDQIIWCLCVLAMGDLFSDCHSKLWHYRVRTIVCKPLNNGAKIFMKLHLLLFTHLFLHKRHGGFRSRKAGQLHSYIYSSTNLLEDTSEVFTLRTTETLEIIL